MKASNLRISVVLIGLLLIVAFTGCTDLFRDYESAGEKDPISVPKSTYSSLILDIQLTVGSITFDVAPNASYLVDVVNRVSIREGSDGTLAEAAAATASEIDSTTMKLQFDSADDDTIGVYKYDLFIKVSADISLQIDFLATTAEIKINLVDKTLTISALDLETTTGSLTLTLGELLLSDSSPTILTTTGNQIITLTNLQYAALTLWSISGSTGGVDLDLTDSNVPSSNSSLTHSFTVDFTTGSINVLSDLHQDIGVEITTSVTTGSVNIPGSGETYTSPNYASSSLIYVFDLTTTTGSITFS